MNVRDVIWAGVLVGCAAALAAGDLARARPVDPSGVSGASAATCQDCRDMLCGYCPAPAGCHELYGYCYETVRNVSKFCVARPDGPYERCKWRIDDQGSCVTQLLNPCTPERVVCAIAIGKCGPMGICIPEGTCAH